MNIKKINIIIGFLLIGAAPAFCAVPTENALDQITNLYKVASSNWAGTLTAYALRLFYILAVIDMTWMAINLALRPGDFPDWAANLVKKVLFLGFFWMLLLPGASGYAFGLEINRSIVQSLLNAGSNVSALTGGVGVTPADIFDLGWNICKSILDESSVWDPIDSLVFIIGAIVLIIIYALMAAMMLLVYVQSYIIIYAGVIFLGFGGSLFTKDIAVTYFRAALSVGAKLFVMTLIVGIGQAIIKSWTSTMIVGLQDMVLFIGAAVVLLALVKEVPNMVSDLIQGFSVGSGDSLVNVGKTGAAMGVGAATGAIIGGVGGSMAVKEAANLAKAQGASGITGVAKGIMSNIATHVKHDLTQKAGGQVGHQDGSMGVRVASAMRAASPEPESDSDSERYISPASRD